MPSTTRASVLKMPKRSGQGGETDFEEWRRAKQLLKPRGQVELQDADLKEIIARVLVTTNPQKPKGLVEFSYKYGKFIDVPLPTNLVVAYKSEGAQIHIDSEEATEQLTEMGYDPEEYRAQARESIPEEVLEEEAPVEVAEAEQEEEGEKPEVDEEEEEEAQPQKEVEEEEHGEGDEDEVEIVEKPAADAPKGRKKKLTNQFNFCERASLTYNLPLRTQEIQTVPPPTANFSGLVLQWVIYDAYQKDFEAQEREKELEKERRDKEKSVVVRPKLLKKKVGRAQLSEAVKTRILESWKVLERMINQNTYHEIAKDFRYWEDPADEFREEEGTLLPLWKFTYDKVRKSTVTDIEWNPFYYDLFAVTFGYLDFTKPVKEGVLCVYTLKNPSFPDYICVMPSAAMCVSTHPNFPYMVAVGAQDGAVYVFNIQQSCLQPAYKSNMVSDKHRGIVWEVKWAPDLPDGELNFFSIASDGRVNNWILMQNSLSVTTVFNLYLPMEPVAGPDGVLLKMRGSACCVAFDPKDPLIYLVGTETGSIYECSTAYSSMYLFEYHAHHMPVYRIEFNRFNTQIFLSCSADWRIKIWEHKRDEPLFVFDVGASVGDAKWAPYSSTVFAAVTTYGKVFIFDINVNKYKAICEQAAVSRRRNRLSRISFNYKLPIIIVGDDKGCVTTLKLSPNLRLMCKPPKKQQNLDQFTLQCLKLEKLLAYVREPPVLTAPPDTAGSDD